MHFQKKLLLSDILYECGDTCYECGQSYFEMGSVLGLDIKGEGPLFVQFNSSVKGSSKTPYKQNIRIIWLPDFSAAEIEGDCTCSVSYNCKHVAAACLMYQASDQSLMTDNVKPSILDLPKILDNHSRNQLCFIIKQFGRSIIDDPRRCRGLLKDLAPYHKRETNLLFMALEEKTVAELANINTQVPLAILIERLAQRLHDNVGTQKEFAIWAVESWAIALDIIQQPIPKQTTKLDLKQVETKQAKSDSYKREKIKSEKQVATKPTKSDSYKLGDIHPDERCSFIFQVDASGMHGLMAKEIGCSNSLIDAENSVQDRYYFHGWRLPNKDELNLLYTNARTIKSTDWIHGTYWSSTKNYSGGVWIQSFTTGIQEVWFECKYTPLIVAIKNF
jgi:hypothetical protein